MRKIDEIILHCTATPEGREVTVAEIDSWHRQRGFDGIGYHYIVHLDGTVEAGRPLAEVGAHCKGHNSRSIGIAYVGGCDRAGNPKDTRTDAQRKSLRLIVSHFLDYYPGATVHGNLPNRLTHSERRSVCRIYHRRGHPALHTPQGARGCSPCRH